MYEIIIQHVVPRNSSIPKSARLKEWAQLALMGRLSAAEVTIRIVSVEEMTELNSTYRHKRKPTNVLSFPFEVPVNVPMDLPLLGDIVICADVIAKEAAEQRKTPEAHWAHMVVHGVLHLLGYDHEICEEAEFMEAQEITILSRLGFKNPYKVI